MKRLIAYLVLIVFILSGCSVHRIQKRHARHGKRYTKKVMKKRYKYKKLMKKRPSIRSMAVHKKLKVKKFGGTYIMR